MLSVLRIQNFAIIEESEIEFGPGLNVLSGETGAGKSIILKSMELLTGARATPDVIRSGAEKCIIEGLFRLPSAIAETLRSSNESFAEIITDEELLIRRVIDRSGKSKCHLNGSLITASALQQLTTSLIDITGQHSQQTLLDPAKHLSLLDQFGVRPESLAAVRDKFREFSSVSRELSLLQTNASERSFYLERIAAERAELANAALEIGERESLEQELLRLANVESLGSSVTSCLDALSEGEQSIEDSVRGVLMLLEQACKLDPSLKEVRDLVNSAAVELSEAQLSLAEYQASLDADPERLEALRDRIAEIARLERKYRKTVPELVAYLASIAAELDSISGDAFDEDKLRARTEQLRAELGVLEQSLSSERTEAGARLARLVESGLAELSMKRARFGVSISPKESSATGSDDVTFTLAANPGEPFRPLVKVASGGELSRILLVLKVVLNEKTMPSTQIFDEVDAGIGGAVAQVVGEKLKDVSTRAQVILVTHAPQIAAFANQHFLIAKTSSDEATTSTVTELDRDASVQQIAQMLAGKEVSSDFTKSARTLIAEAEQSQPPRKVVSTDVASPGVVAPETQPNLSVVSGGKRKKRVNE